MAKRNKLEENLASNKIKKKAVFDEKQADKVIKAVHTEKQKEQKEKEVQTTIYFPKSLHKQMRAKLLEDETTMKEYLIYLVKKDMGIS